MASVTCELRDDVAVVTVDDGKANAYSHELIDELLGALDAAESLRAPVVLAGRPGRFSAGFDLATMTSGNEPMRALLHRGAELLLRLFTFPAPLVIACTGHALAFGGILLFTGDHRIGADGEFKIGLNETQIGLPLPLFAAELARYRLSATGLEDVLFGRVVSPERAVALGFLDEVVGSDEVVDRSMTYAAELAALHGPVVARTKLALRAPVVERITATLDEDLATLTKS